MLQLKDVTKTYITGELTQNALKRRQYRLQRKRVRFDPRTQRFGKNDSAEHYRRPGSLYRRRSAY